MPPGPFGLSLSKPRSEPARTIGHFDKLSPFDKLRTIGHFDKLSANGAG
jgi:hypothetical protein